MLPPPNCQPPANAYIRKRSSLVEALNNSIFPPSPDIGQHRRSVDISTVIDYDNNYMMNDCEQRRIERVYSVKQVVQRVNDDYDYFGRIIPQDDQHPSQEKITKEPCLFRRSIAASKFSTIQKEAFRMDIAWIGNASMADVGKTFGSGKASESDRRR
ncbi:hypothetical protein Tcan_11263 [Toxocara canis]|uniref:Uncharacterized protein n=1 Tax=Toxocara canis TaxID=6265 RepID=A0A0B2V3Q9_TOXCA|nr:hypothetical protein Tcan_11263 [Toxocara canis]